MKNKGFKFDKCLSCRLSVEGIYSDALRRILCEHCAGGNYQELTEADKGFLEEFYLKKESA